VAVWSVPVTLVVALAGTGISRDMRFAASCLAGAAFDIGTLRWMLGRSKAADPHEAIASGPLAFFLLFRLVIKAVLLVAASLLSQWLDVLGMAAGVVIVDITLATAGSASAALHAFRPHQPNG
jgi:hypothetical protein